MTAMQTFPEADVICWKATDFFIQCPFCDGVHLHTVNWKTVHPIKASHCEKMGDYICCFPVNDQGEVASEIDKRRGRYTNICVPHDSDNEEYGDVDRPAIELAQKATVAAQREEQYASIHGDSKKLVTINPGHDIKPFEQKRILQPISDCVSGDVEAVQEYLETFSEAQLFVRGRLSDGQTTLISAAVEQSSAMIAFLIKHGAEVNAVGISGTTALMEAALFGRIENVKVLLNHGADKNIRDVENRLAIDFARALPKNRQEVYDRTAVISSSHRRLGHIEDTFNRDIDRQDILRLLGGEIQRSKIVFGKPPTLLLSNSYFKTSPMQDSLVLYGPIEEYPITSSWKTVARLERNGKFPSVGAMSGWSHCSVQSFRVDGDSGRMMSFTPRKWWVMFYLLVIKIVGKTANIMPATQKSN